MPKYERNFEDEDGDIYCLSCGQMLPDNQEPFPFSSGRCKECDADAAELLEEKARRDAIDDAVREAHERHQRRAWDELFGLAADVTRNHAAAPRRMG